MKKNRGKKSQCDGLIRTHFTKSTNILLSAKYFSTSIVFKSPVINIKKPSSTGLIYIFVCQWKRHAFCS